MNHKFEQVIKKIVFENVIFDQQVMANFSADEKNVSEIYKSIIIAFFVVLSGKSHSDYAKAKQFLDKVRIDEKYGPVAEFFHDGVNHIRSEISNQSIPGFELKMDDILQHENVGSDKTEMIEKVWGLFFPEGVKIYNAENRIDEIDKLRENRTIHIKKQNEAPITDPINEMIFTSNILLTIPLKNTSIDKLKIDQSKKEKLKSTIKEEQKFWYDHPIPIGIEPEKNEAIYGIEGLAKMLEYESKKSAEQIKSKLKCVLSVSVTHSGLHEIAKDYLQNEIKQNTHSDLLDIYVFTESETNQIIDEVLKPIAERYAEQSGNRVDDLYKIFGVDGEYGRHYNFLKAITAFWQVFIDSKRKATFKIDLDQVFPQDELVEQSGASALEHFTTPKWGAKGVDNNGNEIELGMIAGALVNESDIHKSLFYPDIRFSINNDLQPDEWIFCSKLPQALSTEAEMMTRYDTEKLNGVNEVISRVHVTGGTNGILVDMLRKHRPFTPSFIGRARSRHT